MPRHRVVERSRIAFSMKIFLETAPFEAANSASSWRSTNAGGPARPYVSWDKGTKRHAPDRTCSASTHLWLRQTPQSPRLRRQPQRTQAGESHTLPPPLAAPGGTGGGHRAGGRAGSVAGAVLCRWRRRSGRRLPHRGVRGGLGAGGGATEGGAAATAALGAAAAFATAGTAAAEASPGATAAACPAAATSPGVGGAAELSRACRALLVYSCSELKAPAGTHSAVRRAAHVST